MINNRALLIDDEMQDSLTAFIWYPRFRKDLANMQVLSYLKLCIFKKERPGANLFDLYYKSLLMLLFQDFILSYL